MKRLIDRHQELEEESLLEAEDDTNAAIVGDKGIFYVFNWDSFRLFVRVDPMQFENIEEVASKTYAVGEELSQVCIYTSPHSVLILV